jgi:hypothetical protein
MFIPKNSAFSKYASDLYLDLLCRGLQYDDEMCGHITRNITLHSVGDAEKGTVCPRYPLCTGKLHWQVSIFRWIPLDSFSEYRIADCNFFTNSEMLHTVFNSPDPDPYIADVLL